jgi:hypothetical protein
MTLFYPLLAELIRDQRARKMRGKSAVYTYISNKSFSFPKRTVSKTDEGVIDISQKTEILG